MARAPKAEGLTVCGVDIDGCGAGHGAGLHRRLVHADRHRGAVRGGDQGWLCPVFWTHRFSCGRWLMQWSVIPQPHGCDLGWGGELSSWWAGVGLTPPPAIIVFAGIADF